MLHQKSDPLTENAKEIAQNYDPIDQLIYPLPHLSQQIDSSDDNICMCEIPTDESTKEEGCCRDLSCLNFATYVECSPHCPVGKYCGNQRLQKREFPKCEAFKTLCKGVGVRTLEPVKAFSMIEEYLGEVIDQEELDKRKALVPKREVNSYYLLLGPATYSDARRKGNLMRFLNHSCDPNCKTERWSVAGETRVAITAIKDIASGEELTIDYQWKNEGRQIRCMCESPNCHGTIGVADDDDDATLERSTGIFREPKAEEIGRAIVGKRIRLWSSQSSSFRTAMIQSFNENDNSYLIRYEKANTADEKWSLDKNNQNEDEDNNGLATVQLPGRRWHIFVDFEGQTEEDIQKLVFSIPKVQRPDTEVPESRKKRLNQPISAVAENSTTVRSFFGQKQDEAYTPSRFLLIKNIDPTHSETSARYVIQSYTGSSNCLRFDYVQFLHEKAWALVEFSSEKLLKMVQQQLAQRYELGRRVATFPASRFEFEQFERFKLACVRQKPAEKVPKSSDIPESTRITRRPYCFGVRLNWLMTEKELQNSPNRQAGVAGAVESDFLRAANKMINKAAGALGIERSDASQAVILLQRYMHTSRIDLGKIADYAAASLHIVVKAQCRKIKSQDYFATTYETQYSVQRVGSTIKPGSEQCRFWGNKIMTAQVKMLEALHYDLCLDDPYAILDKITSGVIIPTPITKEARRIVSESHADTIWVRVPADYIVLAALYISAASNFIYTWSNPKHTHLEHTNTDRAPEWLPAIGDQFALPLEWLTTAIHQLMTLHDTRATYLSPRPDRIEVENLAMKFKKERTGDFVDDNASDTSASSIEDDEMEAETNARAICYECVSLPPPKSSALHVHSKAFSTMERIQTHAIVDAKPLGKNCFMVKLTELAEVDIPDKVFIQPLPFHGGKSSSLDDLDEKGSALPQSAIRELALQTRMQLIAPWGILCSMGIIFPSSEIASEAETLDFDSVDKGKKKASKQVVDRSKHYMMFERPLHNFSGLMSKGIEVAEPIVRQTLRDILRVIAASHAEGVVLRCVTMSNVYMFRNRAKLGGLHAARQGKFDSHVAKKRGYKLNSKDIIEHSRGGALAVAAPEVLLGAKVYTTKSDMWAFGCLVASMILRCHLFKGTDNKSQLEYIFRISGSPREGNWSEGSKMPNFRELRPKTTYRNRLQKTLAEKGLESETINLLENLLCLDPEQRLSAEAALDLPYFKGQPECFMQEDWDKLLDVEPCFAAKCVFAKSYRKRPLISSIPHAESSKAKSLTDEDTGSSDSGRQTVSSISTPDSSMSGSLTPNQSKKQRRSRWDVE